MKVLWVEGTKGRNTVELVAIQQRYPQIRKAYPYRKCFRDDELLLASS